MALQYFEATAFRASFRHILTWIQTTVKDSEAACGRRRMKRMQSVQTEEEEPQRLVYTVLQRRLSCSRSAVPHRIIWGRTDMRTRPRRGLAPWPIESQGQGCWNVGWRASSWPTTSASMWRHSSRCPTISCPWNCLVTRGRYRRRRWDRKQSEETGSSTRAATSGNCIVVNTYEALLLYRCNCMYVCMYVYMCRGGNLYSYTTDTTTWTDIETEY